MYLALTRLAFQRQFAYRTANLAGLVTNLFFGVLRAFLFIALFAARPEVAGYTVRDAVTYTALTQALIAYFNVFGWWEVMRSIRTGEIATDLSRPLDYFGFWWAQDVGRAVHQLLVRGLPVLVFYAFTFGLQAPPAPENWLALGPALILALFISFCFRFLVNLAAFWMVDAVGFGRVVFFSVLFISGFLVPVAFFPPWLRALAELTPFPAIVNTPIEVYLGIVRGPALLAALAVQAGWGLALYLAVRGLLALGVRKLVVQGG